MLTYPPLPMSSDGAVQNAPSLIYESSHTSPSQHTWTTSSSSYMVDQCNGNHEIWKSLMMTFPNSCLSIDVDDQLCSTILLWIHLHWELGADITLKVSAPSIAGIASLATYHISSTEFFSAKQPIFKFYSAKLSEEVKFGVHCVRVLFHPYWTFTMTGCKMLTLSNSWIVHNDDENMWHQGSVHEQFDTFPFLFILI